MGTYETPHPTAALQDNTFIKQILRMEQTETTPTMFSDGKWINLENGWQNSKRKISQHPKIKQKTTIL
jgi:hypothetical protein